jgi:hypothetical protein
MGVQAGTFHNLTEPDQLPVANVSPFGANRTREIGRSSPICEPRFENVLNDDSVNECTGLSRTARTFTSAKTRFRMSIIRLRGSLLSNFCWMARFWAL